MILSFDGLNKQQLFLNSKVFIYKIINQQINEEFPEQLVRNWSKFSFLHINARSHDTLSTKNEIWILNKLNKNTRTRKTMAARGIQTINLNKQESIDKNLLKSKANDFLHHRRRRPFKAEKK